MTAEGFNASVYQYYPDPPAALSTIVKEFKLTSQSGFVRVFDYTHSNPSGRWIVLASDISGLTLAQIRDKLALAYTPTHICDVIVAEQNTMNVLVGNGLYGMTGQEIQYYLKDGTAFSQFINERLLQ